VSTATPHACSEVRRRITGEAVVRESFVLTVPWPGPILAMRENRMVLSIACRRANVAVVVVGSFVGPQTSFASSFEFVVVTCRSVSACRGVK